MHFEVILRDGGEGGGNWSTQYPQKTPQRREKVSNIESIPRQDLNPVSFIAVVTSYSTSTQAFVV